MRSPYREPGRPPTPANVEGMRVSPAPLLAIVVGVVMLIVLSRTSERDRNNANSVATHVSIVDVMMH